MRHSTIEPAFENRYDAGRKLAERLWEYAGKSVVVLGIPNGGMAVALNVALALKADLDIVISRKIPLPLSPEGGFGSITDDGTMILNQALVSKMGLTREQIDAQVSQVRQDIRGRSLLYRKDKRPLIVSGRTVIVIDDGLASGYTMRAAVESLRLRKPQTIIAAAPGGPEKVTEELMTVADRVVTCAINPDPTAFYISDYYKYWADITDDEVIQCLKEWRVRRYQSTLEVPERKPQAPGV